MSFAAGTIAELYVGEYRRLKLIVTRLLYRPDAADDVLQDTFMKLSHLDLVATDRGLLVRAAQTMARDYNRSEKNRSLLAARAQANPLANPIASPEESVVARCALSSLFNAIQSMPRRRAQILLLAKLDGLPYAAIAEKLGISLSTVEKEMASAMLFCHRWRKEHDFS